MASRREKPTQASVKLGVPGLDALIGAALAPGASIALSGPAQSGKTWLAVQFLLAGNTDGQALLYVKVSPRKEAPEVLPFAEQLREFERSGRASVKSERLNRPLAPWLGAWLDRAGSDSRIVIEVAASIDELSPREASWLSDARRELALRGVTALFSVRASGAEPRVIGLLSRLFGDATATLALEFHLDTMARKLSLGAGAIDPGLHDRARFVENRLRAVLEDCWAYQRIAPAEAFDPPAAASLSKQLERAATSEVELISSPNVRLAGVIEGDSHPVSFQGGVNRTFGPPKAVIEFVPLGIMASPSMPKRLVTSGLGGVFPPGLTLGTLTNLTLGADGLFQSGEVSLDDRLGTLTEVTVLVPLNPE